MQQQQHVRLTVSQAACLSRFCWPRTAVTLTSLPSIILRACHKGESAEKLKRQRNSGIAGHKGVWVLIYRASGMSTGMTMVRAAVWYMAV